jgi:hypothetical protein
MVAPVVSSGSEGGTMKEQAEEIEQLRTARG